MRKAIAASICGVLALSAPVEALAQFGGLGASLGHLIPGAQPAPGAGVNADQFLQDTRETTKIMMISAALLHQAVQDKDDLASTKAYIDSVNNAQDCKELEAHKAQFQNDLNAVAANQQSTAALQAAYDHGTEEQRRLIRAAMFNFALGLWRNVRLGEEANQLTGAMRTNPALFMKVPELTSAAGLIVLEGKAGASVAGSLHTVMAAVNVDPPVQAEATKPQPVSFQ